MPWNQQKVYRELNRSRLPSGREAALLDAPSLGYRHLLDLLKSGSPTPSQAVHALRLIQILAVRKQVEVDPVDLVNATRSYLDSPIASVRLAAARSLAHYCLHAAVYAHFTIPSSELIGLVGCLRPIVQGDPSQTVLEEAQRALGLGQADNGL